MLKRVTSGGVRPRNLKSRQHSSEEASQRRRAVGDTVSDFTDPGFEPQIFYTDSNVLTTELDGKFMLFKTIFQPLITASRARIFNKLGRLKPRASEKYGDSSQTTKTFMEEIYHQGLCTRRDGSDY